MNVKIKRVHQNAKVPTFATGCSAGLDCYAPIDDILMPRERKLIPLGFILSIPEGYEAQVRPRSGMALKDGIMVSNSPGTIDADYRGEVGVILWNTSDTEFHIKEGMRICQLVFNRYEVPYFLEVSEVDKTERGEGGFASTGR